MTAPEGSPARAAQEKALSECLKWCEYYAEAIREFSRRKDQAGELLGLILEIDKEVTETRTSVLRNIG